MVAAMCNSAAVAGALFILWTVLSLVAGASSSGSIHLQNGKYTGLLVAVDRNIPYDGNIVNKIQNYFTFASSALYDATRDFRGRRFGEVTVLLPRSWPRDPSCDPISSELQNEANFVIQADNVRSSNAPVTVKLDSRCGTPGQVTYVPRGFLDNVDANRWSSNQVGKVLLHEWAKLRYGVFSESSVDGTSCLISGDEETTLMRCSTELRGKVTVSTDGRSCSFVPDQVQEPHVQASLMYDPTLDSVSKFCNISGSGVTHNKMASNPQNDRCDGKSVWEVLMLHDDFGPNQHAVASSGDDVSFRCVQELEHDRMVLVMDVSGSMLEQNRLARMRQDVRLFLEGMPCRDTSMGMVEFSGNMFQTTVLHNMTRLDVSLDSLIAAIPNKTLVETCIGCGILRTIAMLESSGKPTAGTSLVIFTDGQETIAPKIRDVRELVLAKGLVVYGIMLMSQASDHPLIQLADETGGQACIYSDSLHSTYYDCLNNVLHHRSPETAPSQIMNEYITVERRGESVSGQVIVESSLKQYLRFTITYTIDQAYGCEDLEAVLTAPDSSTISKTSSRYYHNKDVRTILVDASGFQSGSWQYKLINQGYWLNCTVRFLADARKLYSNCSREVTENQDEPVLITTVVDRQKVTVNTSRDPLDNAIKIYTTVLKEGQPVVNASVDAEIEDEDGTKYYVRLDDDGVGPDSQSGDGVYSTYFTDYERNGTHTVKVNVEGDGDTVVKKPSDDGYEYENLDPFMRISVGEFFNIYGVQNSSDSSRYNFPPAKVVDLTVTDSNAEQRLLGVKFTAPGDELSSGQASKYDFRMSTDPDHLRDVNNFATSVGVLSDSVMEGDLNSPRPGGSTEHFTFRFLDSEQPNHNMTRKKRQVVDTNQMLFLAMRAENSKGLVSPVSNVVSFVFYSPLVIMTSSPTIPSTTESTNTSAIPLGSSSGSSFPKWIIFLLVGVAVALFFIVVLLFTGCCRRTKNKDDETVVVGATPETADEAVEQGYHGYDTLEVDVTTINPVMYDSGSPNPDIVIEAERSIKRNSERTHSGTSTPNVMSVRSSRCSSAKSTARSSRKSTVRSSILKFVGRGIFLGDILNKRNNNQARHPDTDTVRFRNIHHPIENHPYSNPLYGEGRAEPEVEVPVSVIVTEEVPNKQGTTTYEDVLL